MKTFEVGDPSPVRPAFASPPLSDWTNEADVVASANYHPFQAVPVVGAAKVTFEPGTITASGMNISPNVGATPIATTTRPELTITTSGTIYLEATIDAAGVPTGIELKNASSTPTDTTTLKRKTITNLTLVSGLVTITGRPVRASMQFRVCGGVAEWI